MATLGYEIKNIRSELQEHRVNAAEGDPRTVDPNQKGRQNATSFCNYCRTNGHIPQVGVERRYETKKWNSLKTKEMPRKKSPVLKITTKSEHQIMDQNNGPEAKIFKERTRTFLTIDLREVPLLPTRISLQDRTSHMGITIRTMEDHMINAQITQSIETMETDLEMDLSAIRMGTSETMETFLFLNPLKGETSQKKFLPSIKRWSTWQLCLPQIWQPTHDWFYALRTKAPAKQ